MPTMPKRACRQPGCRELVNKGFCRQHAHKYDKHRGTAAQRGYDGRWRKYRKGFLADNPFCVECLKYDRLTAATVIDHVTPHKGDQELFWDLDNHQALCEQCHNKKSASKDGGFGRRIE